MRDELGHPVPRHGARLAGGGDGHAVVGRGAAVAAANALHLVYYGLDGLGETRWWNWTGQPAGDVACWSIAAASMSAGAVAFFLTPWSLRRVAALTGLRGKRGRARRFLRIPLYAKAKRNIER